MSTVLQAMVSAAKAAQAASSVPSPAAARDGSQEASAQRSGAARKK